MARPSPAPGKQEPGIECRNFSVNQLPIAMLQLKAASSMPNENDWSKATAEFSLKISYLLIYVL